MRFSAFFVAHTTFASTVVVPQASAAAPEPVADDRASVAQNQDVRIGVNQVMAVAGPNVRAKAQGVVHFGLSPYPGAMSCDFTVDRNGTWYGPNWNTSSGIFTWVLRQVADLTDVPEVEAAVRERLADHGTMFFLSWYTEEQAAEIVRVVLGPLRESLRGETPHVRREVEELIAMAEGWAEATDVFPLFLPWRFVLVEEAHYRCEPEGIDVVFAGVGEANLPGELRHPEIGLTEDGYAVSAVGFSGVVPAAGLRVLGHEHNGPLEHTVAV